MIFIRNLFRILLFLLFLHLNIIAYEEDQIIFLCCCDACRIIPTFRPKFFHPIRRVDDFG